MSANLWHICPFCRRKRESEYKERISKLQTKLDNTYGKMDASKWRESFENLEKIKKEAKEYYPEETIGDYGGTYIKEDGTVQIVVSGQCNECQEEWDIDTTLEQKQKRRTPFES